MKSYFILYYVLALFLPVILFTVILDNYNENHPVAVYALCIILFAAAGWLSSFSRSLRGKMEWVICSILAGIFEASLLYFAA